MHDQRLPAVPVAHLPRFGRAALSRTTATPPVPAHVPVMRWRRPAGSARAWLGRSPRRLALIGGTGGLVMIGIGTSLAISGRKD
jgi:hypothetical protein